jgi:hypothetical protein
MTFTEIYNHVYRSSDGIRERVNALPDAERRALGVIAVFCGRKGFSFWWDTIGQESRDEIFEELKGLADP